jgi:hypothetical protein
MKLSQMLDFQGEIHIQGIGIILAKGRPDNLIYGKICTNSHAG